VNRRLRRGAAIAALAFALSATGAGCGAGFDAPVYLVRPENVNAEVGDLLLRSLVLVKAEGADSAALAGAFVNRGDAPDTLTSVEVEAGSAPLSASPNLEVPFGQSVILGGTEGEAITFSGAEGLSPGRFVPVTLTFRDAGSVTLKLLVEDAKGHYEDYAPPGGPTPAATPSPEGSPAPGEAEAPEAGEQPEPAGH